MVLTSTRLILSQYPDFDLKADDAQDANVGKLLEVNTDGKWQVATTGTSRFEFAGVMDDNGHKLIMISVLPEAKTVA